MARKVPFAISAQLFGIALARNQRGQHGAPRRAQDIGGHAGQLDVRGLEQLLNPVRFRGSRLGQGLPIPRQIPQLTDRLRWNEAPAQ